MLEAFACCLVAWLLLAAASFRFRRAIDLGPEHVVRLRVAGALLLGLALFACAGPLPGERVVRFLGVASIAGVVVTALLSVRPQLLRGPARCLRRR